MTASSPTQWECEPDAHLAIPDEILAPCRFKFTVYLGTDKAQLHGRCVSWEALPGGAIRLHRVLSDTSDRPMGVTLKKRMTWRPEIVVTGAAVVVAQLTDDELARHAWRNDDVAVEHRGHYVCQLCGRPAGDPLHDVERTS